MSNLVEQQRILGENRLQTLQTLVKSINNYEHDTLKPFDFRTVDNFKPNLPTVATVQDLNIDRTWYILGYNKSNGYFFGYVKWVVFAFGYFPIELLKENPVLVTFHDTTPLNTLCKELTKDHYFNGYEAIR
jgi:hypothetical protein